MISRLQCIFIILIYGPVSMAIAQNSQDPSSSVVNQTSTTPTSSSACFVNTEGDEVYCRSTGTCDGTPPNATGCSCDAFYSGNDCGQLDLRIPTKDVFETGISFIWPSGILLKGFVSVFTRTPLTDNSELTLASIPANLTDTVTVTGLEPDAKEYLVCIVHEDYLGNVSSLNMSVLIAENVLDNAKANCGVAVTPFDALGPYTLAAWGIAGAIVVTVLLLLVVRACCDCRHSARREILMAKALGKFDFLLRHSSKKDHETPTSGAKGKNGSGSAYVAVVPDNHNIT